MPTQKSGRNRTAITNPKTKSQNTDANTKGTRSKTAASKGSVAQSKAGFGRNNSKGGSNMKTSSKSSQNQSWGSDMEVSSDQCSFKDYDIASDIVARQKYLISLYGTALCEMDCNNLRNIVNNQLTEVGTDQYDIFLYMNERGMYPTEQAEDTKVKEAIDQYSQKSNIFNKKY